MPFGVDTFASNQPKDSKLLSRCSNDVLVHFGSRFNTLKLFSKDEIQICIRLLSLADPQPLSQVRTPIEVTSHFCVNVSNLLSNSFHKMGAKGASGSMQAAWRNTRKK